MTDLEKYAPRAARVIACKLIDKALRQGLKISVNDGVEWTVKHSQDRAVIIAALASAECDCLQFNDDNGKLGKVWLIWGNDEDVISDYSDDDAIIQLVEGI